MSGRIIPRLGLAGTGLFGLLALYAAGLLSPWFAAIGWILLAAAHLASAIWTSELAARARRFAGVLVLVCGAAIALVQVGDQGRGSRPSATECGARDRSSRARSCAGVTARQSGVLGVSSDDDGHGRGVTTTADLVVPLLGGWGAAMATLVAIFYLPDPRRPTQRFRPVDAGYTFPRSARSVPRWPWPWSVG